MNRPILHALAELYRNSGAGKGTAKSTKYICHDYEVLLAKADASDGDEREIAERDLQIAEKNSSGFLVIDRGKRGVDSPKIHLTIDGGEAWLFSRIGEISPSEERQNLRDFFLETSGFSVPERWKIEWSEWFSKLAQKALSGESVQPFQRNKSAENLALVRALAGVLGWEVKTLKRYASTSILGDSKAMKTLENRLCLALEEITGRTSLEEFGISEKPRAVTFHGPLKIRFGSAEVDFSVFPAPVILSEGNFMDSPGIFSSAPICLTVENESVFYELASTNKNGVLLIQTSYPGFGTIQLLERLPEDMLFYHFGDTDPAGYDILCDLRERAGRKFQPLLMEYRPSDQQENQEVKTKDLHILKRLLSSEHADIHPHLHAILESGKKGAFEQEGIPVEKVWNAVGDILDC